MAAVVLQHIAQQRHGLLRRAGPGFVGMGMRVFMVVGMRLAVGMFVVVGVGMGMLVGVGMGMLVGHFALVDMIFMLVHFLPLRI